MRQSSSVDVILGLIFLRQTGWLLVCVHQVLTPFSWWFLENDSFLLIYTDPEILFTELYSQGGSPQHSCVFYSHDNHLRVNIALQHASLWLEREIPPRPLNNRLLT